MDLVLDVESGAVEVQPEKKKFLKYTSDMERLLLVTILATSAHSCDDALVSRLDVSSCWL
jgi:hypothetical protein